MAEFRDQKRLEDFDFGFNLSIKESEMDGLATYRFVSERRDVLWYDHRVWERVICARRPVYAVSEMALPSTVGRSSIGYGTFCMTKPWRDRNESCRDT